MAETAQRDTEQSGEEPPTPPRGHNVPAGTPTVGAPAAPGRPVLSTPTAASPTASGPPARALASPTAPGPPVPPPSSQLSTLASPTSPGPPLSDQHEDAPPHSLPLPITPGSGTASCTSLSLKSLDEKHGAEAPAPTASGNTLPLGDTSALLNLPPPPPFDLAVENLTVGVPKHSRLARVLQGDLNALKPSKETGPRKTIILDDVSCACPSGQVLAILGGSGSGKTTLLNAVAHRLNDLPVKSGDVSYVPALGGPALSRHEAKRRIGFVRQQDFLVECLTVRETLTYAARLRLPTSLSRDAINLIVEQTLDELGLRGAADTVVGGPLRKGISGGEKRRLSIGCVLVTLPSVLILDEPTSGLDAFTSYLLLQTLSALARRGRTVILSIHAPRSDAYPFFDRICLMTRGKVVYSGPRRDCLPWFSGLGYDLETGVNPLDFLIDVSSIDNRTEENEEASVARVGALTNAWAAHVAQTPDRLRHPAHSEVAARPRRPSSASHHSAEAAELHRVVTHSGAKDQKRPGFFTQTRVLTARAHRNVYRNVPQLVGLAMQGIILGLFVGITYANIPDTPTGIQSLKNLCFQFVPAVFYLQQVFWIYKFCKDLIIFDREREDNLYDVVPYVLSDWVSFILPAVFTPTIYAIILWFMAGMRDDDVAKGLFTVIASTMLVQCAVQGLALFASSVTRSFPAASLIGNAINIQQLLSAGFILVHPPAYAKWVRWLSPYFYSFRIVATVVFKDRVFDCPPVSDANLEQCDGNNVLRGFDFDLDLNIGVWFAGVFAFALFEYVISCAVLRYLPVGGVRHASEIDSHHRGKNADVADSHMTRDRIDVAVRNLSFGWERRGRGLVKSARKVILDDVTVNFPAGEVSAILGPSGAGKSTLLQLIASRTLRAGALGSFYRTGHLLFNGAPVSALSRSNVAFVEQEDDWHLPSLTVRETLRYAAILRLPDEMSRKQKVARAETVLRMLGLKDCADLPVGGPLIKGISGGEKRRLSLAVQMINDPAVLVVDEPTSGLDSSIALSVMQVLKDIAATGRTVIATIHQPRSDIWRLADNVTLLAKGGVVAYTGKRDRAIKYFSGIGYPMPSEFFNPADHLLDLVSVDPRKPTHAASEKRVRALTDAWRMLSPETGDENVLHHDEPRAWGSAARFSLTHNDKAQAPGISENKLSHGSRTTSMRVAFPVVLQRHWLNLWRQPEVFFNRWFQAPFVGALFILYFQRLSLGPQGAQDRIGQAIQSTSALGFVGLLNSMAILPAERNLYLHEAASSARYSPATFVAMYTLVKLGPEIFASLGYSAIMNVGAGMQTSPRIFFEFFATIWCMHNMGESFALIVGMWIPSEGVTVTILSTFLSLLGQTAGVVSLNVPRWLAGIAWGTAFKPSVKVQIINECVGLVFKCSREDVLNGKCIAQTGDQIIALFGWHDLNTARFVGIAIATTVAWRVLAWWSVAGRVGGFR